MNEIRHEQELEGLTPEETLERLNPDRRRDGGGRQLIWVGLAVGVLLGVVLFLRAHDTAQADSEICVKLDRLDAALIAIVSSQSAPTKAGEPGFDYYEHHPVERQTLVSGQAEATKKALVLLRSAACDPKSLPSVRGAP